MNNRHIIRQIAQPNIILTMIGIMAPGIFPIYVTARGDGDAGAVTSAKLIIAPSKVQIKSGDSPQVQASLQNLGVNPLRFGLFFGWQAMGVTPAHADDSLHRTRYGHILSEESLGGSRVRVTIPPRDTWTFNGGHGIEPLSEYDLTMPGETYRLRFTFKGIPGTLSKPVSITVKPPYGQPPADALVKSALPNKSLSAALPGKTQLLVKRVSHNGEVPVLLAIYLRVGKAAGGKIRLTGNPLVDFQQIRVGGPDDLKFVKAPKPHYLVIPNRKKPVPLTAYGKWLATHEAAKELQWETYTLKPGEVYKYVVPVNLSCQFDLSVPSVPGNYHVHLQLTHSDIKSAWTDIRIP